MISGTYFERKFKHRREMELEAAREEARAAGREEGRAEARAEVRKRNAEFNALLADWVKRSDEAREKGEPFDEPMPRPERVSGIAPPESLSARETEKNAMIVGTYFERKFKHRREMELEAVLSAAREEARTVVREELTAAVREEARAAVRKETIAEFNTLLDEWEKRRDEAAEKGKRFDDPIPRLRL